MKIELYDTQRREKTALSPIDRKAVRLYVCGPTVYDFAHIGNARPAIVFDVLFRLLRHVYGEAHVVYARNITDLDDKINARAARDFPELALNAAIARVTAGTARQYIADVGALGCLEPTHQPRATEHIEGMVALIERLVARGFAYLAEGHALFSPSAMDASPGAQKYGSLSRRPFDEMIAGARVDVAPYKRDPMDFVLWKPSKPGEPGWRGPAGLEGLGRPGWHIECSAMSMEKLLEPFGGGLQCDSPEANVFDIHGGGIDLVFPHHENEIAQTCCALGAPRMANIFMHNGFLQVEGAKMAKSAGNFITIDDLLRKEAFGGRAWPGAVLRFAMLRTHYRQPIDWTLRSLEESEATLQKFAEAIDAAAPLAAPSVEMASALADDLNVSEAIAHLHALHRAAKDVGAPHEARTAAARQLAADLVFIGIDATAARAPRALDDGRISQLEALIERRLQARRDRDWKESDRLRGEINALGVTLQDGKDGATTWTLTP